MSTCGIHMCRNARTGNMATLSTNILRAHNAQFKAIIYPARGQEAKRFLGTWAKFPTYRWVHMHICWLYEPTHCTTCTLAYGTVCPCAQQSPPASSRRTTHARACQSGQTHTQLVIRPDIGLAGSRPVHKPNSWACFMRPAWIDQPNLHGLSDPWLDRPSTLLLKPSWSPLYFFPCF